MQEFQDLLDIIDKLLGPNGCPWDREQTMKSIRSDLIEESCELVDAIDSDDNPHIQEELGDVMFLAAFMCKLAEKENRAKTETVLLNINEKLVRRHPHVFNGVVTMNVDTSSAVLKQWDAIKSTEKDKMHRKSILDSIPKGLPALARAKKVYSKVSDKGFSDLPKISNLPEFDSESALGRILFALVATAHEQGLDAEHALRQALVSVEGAFREFESKRG